MQGKGPSVGFGYRTYKYQVKRSHMNWEHDMWRGKRETRWTVRGLNQTPIAPQGCNSQCPDHASQR